MTSLEKLNRARKDADTAYYAEQKRLIDQAPFRIGQTVLIARALGTIPPEATMSQKSWNKNGKHLVGKITTIDNIRVNDKHEYTFTTAIRDSTGQRWCWDTAELDAVDDIPPFAMCIDENSCRQRNQEDCEGLCQVYGYREEGEL